MTSPQNKKPSKWVFRSTTASIEAGQISILAVFETLFVLVLYSWLAYHFDYQWWLYLSALAAPLILLRSKPSVQRGLKLLQRYDDEFYGEAYDISKFKGIIIAILSATICFTISDYLANTWLTEYQSWELFAWTTIMVVGVSFVVTISAGPVAGLSAVAGTVLGADMGVVLATVAGTGVVLGSILGSVAGIAGMGVILILGVGANVIMVMSKWWRVYFIFLPFFLPFLLLFSLLLALGIWLHSLFIRLFATLRHPIAGLKQLPDNMREILWTLDFTHPPELLPKAKTINTKYSVDGIIDNSNLIEKIGTISIAILWYIPALLWRWSLKATLWLYWPIAFLLRSPLEKKDFHDVRDHAVRKVKGPSKWLPCLAGAIILWLLLDILPIDILPSKNIIESFPELIQTLFKILNLLSPPEFGLLYFMLWICCLLSLVVQYQTKDLANVHNTIINDETSLKNLNKKGQKRFRKHAKKLEKWFTGLIVAFIFLGYSILLHLAYQHYPNEAMRFIPAGLLGYL